jgi:RNA polymerase sigma factor (sigma-70 family)
MPSTFSHDDRELLAALFTAHRSHLDNLLKRHIWDTHLREDFVHEVFIRVLMKWHLYDQQRHFWPWLGRVALNYLRAQARSRRWQSHLSNVKDLDALIDADACDEPPLEAMVLSEDSERVRKLVADMPDHLRETVTLRYWETKSGPEIAELMKVPVGTVYRRLYQAHQLLKGL